MNILKESGKASMGRWFSIIIFILIFAYCIAPFFYPIWDKTAPVAPDILVYMFMVTMGYVGNTKWVNTFKQKFEGQANVNINNNH